MGEPGECKNSVLYALEQGYRMIDTAMAYGNEDEVGQAIRESGIPREEIFVVTKLRRPHSNSYEETIERCQQSRQECSRIASRMAARKRRQSLGIRSTEGDG